VATSTLPAKVSVKLYVQPTTILHFIYNTLQYLAGWRSGNGINAFSG